jgi:predicted P-loop ATPase
MNNILAEAKRLHDLGFGVIPLLPKSKRPKEGKWTTGERKSWDQFKASYSVGDNVGVRLGEASQIDGNYLACIDIDIKHPDARPKALARLKTLVGATKFPEVRSGAGNGSRHLYCVTPQPFKMITVEKHDDWEVCVYSTGRQMVLSPSIHPSGAQYKWVTPVDAQKDLPVIPLEVFAPVVEKSVDSVDKSKAVGKKENVTLEFKVVPVDLGWLPIHDNIREMIVSGKNVQDRSASLLPVSHALLKAGLTQNEILTVLTDKNNFLGACAYDHAKTESRDRAAAWVWKFTLKRVVDENNAELIFREPIIDAVELSAEQIEAQQKTFDDLHHWTLDLDITEKGVYRTTLKNVVSIIKNAVGSDVIKRDLFAYRDFYGTDTPWGGVKDAAINDDDIQKIKLWFGRNWGMEPSDHIIGGGLTILATDNAFDPMVDFVRGLPKWDEVERLDGWLVKNFEATGNDEYLAQVFRKWLVAMVARILKPGAKFDWLPIFEGPQGVGKSSFGRILVGEKYFLDWLPDLSNKDSALALQGVGIVEMGELASFRKTEVEIVKAYITRTVDKVRPPYGQRWLESPRRCVFFGTTNFETYLKDESGNRRFKPVKVGQLNFEALIADREQLFAEALYLWEHGFESERTLDTSGEARIYEIQIQGEKMVADDSALMKEAILKHFLDKKNGVENDKLDYTKISLFDLFDSGSIFGGIPPLKNWKYDTRNAMFAGKALKSLGGEKRKIKGIMYWDMQILKKGDTFDE